MLLEGLHIPLTTPFHPDGRLNRRKLASNVVRYSKTPAAGLIVLGPSGEPTLLSDDETREVLSTAAEEPSPAGGGHSAAGGKPPPSGGEPSPSGEVLGAPAGYGPGQDPCATSPLYRLTVASLCWDPGKMANPGAAGSSRGRAADGPGGQPPWPT